MLAQLRWIALEGPDFRCVEASIPPLRMGFKPIAAAKADIFSVCLRVPIAILPTLLTMSGASGAYTEPRSPDGKEVMSQ